ncbi:MAG: tetratricopeptide repeat-containing sulfotransferase family protein [Steroidobacteraceae bacterium]
MAAARMARGDQDAAERLFTHALDLEPGHPEASMGLAQLLEHQGRMSAAIEVLSIAARSAPVEVDLLVYLSRLSRTLGDLEGAGHWLRAAQGLCPASPAVVIESAALAADSGQRAAVDELLNSPPDASGELMAARAQWLSATGRLADAEDCWRRYLVTHPEDAGALYALSMLPGAQLTGPDEEALRSILRNRPESRAAVQALLVLARSAEHAHRHEAAFDHFREANRRQRSLRQPPPEDYPAMFLRHASWQEQEILQCLEPVAPSEVSPIWVIGMPRSGTTLIEQMLDAHPAIRGLGEVEYARVMVEALEQASGQPFPAGLTQETAPALQQAARTYLARLSQHAHGASWVMDKLPHNFLRVGILQRLFPTGLFVHCRREPVANCWSIFTHEFADSHAYATDLEELGRYYRLYQTLMDQWRHLLGHRLIEVDLDTLVRQPRLAVSPILAAAGLGWHEGCSRPESNPRPVFTPSAVAIRQQIGRATGSAHLKYSTWLAPLYAGLELT